MQAGERELHLRLDAGRPDDRASLRGIRHMSQERGLAGPGLTAEHQCLTLASTYARDELTQDVAFPDPVEQAR
jgi:hypothetical protein